MEAIFKTTGRVVYFAPTAPLFVHDSVESCEKWVDKWIDVSGAVGASREVYVMEVLTEAGSVEEALAATIAHPGTPKMAHMIRDAQGRVVEEPGEVVDPRQGPGMGEGLPGA